MQQAGLGRAHDGSKSNPGDAVKEAGEAREAREVREAQER